MNTRKTRKVSAASRKYSVYYVPDEEAGGYTAHIPALGIVTEGDTLRQARAMAKDAIRGRVAVLQELGQPVPSDIIPDEVKL